MPGSESGFDSDKSERTCPGLDLFAPNSEGGGCIFGGMVADRRILGSILTIVRPNDVADGQSEAISNPFPRISSSDFFVALYHSRPPWSTQLDLSLVGHLCRRATFFSFQIDSGYCSGVPSVMTVERIHT